jgi:hypothetical protein
MYWFIYLSKAQQAAVPAEATQRIATATARPEIPAPIFYVTREPPIRNFEVPIQAMSSKANEGETSTQRM